ncbi:unnamed protein product [Adineta ricciae]|uniref:Aminoglycoside phosphotransferase domain-containing protein n=2 Tax=Adineta ricciae TaxID=249248 RepID=A0A815PTA8_ADIRI|nr:unnamed protein product [Adineta ricciae]
MENVEDIENLLSLHWPHIFSSIDPSTPITLTKLSRYNWLIKCSEHLSYVLKSSQTNNLDLELKYLTDLNRYFNNEYRVPLPLLTIKNERHVNGKYWLYEYIHGKVYNDCDCAHLFDEKQLILLAKLISKYHQFLITNSSTLSTNKKSTTREHLLKEFKQSIDVINECRKERIDLVNEYYLGCYPLLTRLLEESLSKQEKSHSNRNYLIHRNLRPSKIIWSSNNENDQIVGIIDFENLNYDTLWRDLAVCLSTFCTSSSPSIITDVDRMRIFISEYMKQISGGVAKVSSQTEQEVFHLIVDEIILCACEDFTFIYWQYQHQNELFQGIKALEFYYKRALWHTEHALKR